MRSRFPDDDKSTLEAGFAAQKLAFGPFLFQAARVLRDSGVLEHLNRRGADGATPPEVADAVPGVSLYAARVLLEAGLAAQMVVVDGERYRITRVGYLVLRDPLTRINFDFVHDVCYQGMALLDESLREGRPAGLGVFGPWPTLYEALPHLPPRVRDSWLAFDHWYSDGVFADVLSTVFAGEPKRIVDVGGNTGKFAIACCRHDADVRVTIVDLPGQLAMARENLASNGFLERVDLVAANLLDATQALPAGHDVYWMSQFLDCFGEDEIVGILARANAAMRPDSRLFVLELFWDRQRYEAGRFSLINTSLYFAAIANGTSKMYHSDRMRACVEAAALRIEHVRDDVGPCHTLLECRRA
ncbi:MAG TPA: methyltransferase [Xanthomonadales bacterium]|nr:methyltransferase [Xanthomonadales bacterium]